MVVLLQAPSTGLQRAVVLALVVLAVLVGVALVAHVRRDPDGFVPKTIVTAPYFVITGVIGLTVFAAYYGTLFAAASPRWSTTKPRSSPATAPVSHTARANKCCIPHGVSSPTASASVQQFFRPTSPSREVIITPSRWPVSRTRHGGRPERPGPRRRPPSAMLLPCPTRPAPRLSKSTHPRCSRGDRTHPPLRPPNDPRLQ